MSRLELDEYFVTDVDVDAIEIQLKFSNERFVSFYRNDKDMLKFRILEPSLFIGTTSGTALGDTESSEEEQVASIFLPQQIDPQDVETITVVESV